MKLLELTDRDGFTRYFNPSQVSSFNRRSEGSYVYVRGNMFLIIETPEEIKELLKD